ncbi:MAG: T9SS type A sorting domain-containing protein, partial [Prolixibacteraceae bacterium]|nr:T9SS type A sorting domain-containing protein [Prolixibacteraceae bacterium]
NANWGEEADVEKYFGMMKTQFVDKGIPVILGEYGAYKRNLNPPSDQELNHTSVEYFLRYVTKSASEKGIITYYWDTPGGLFNRSTGAIRDRGVLNAIIQEESSNSSMGFSKQSENNLRFFPNPFNDEINFSGNDLENIRQIDIYNVTGNRVETIEPSATQKTIQMGATLKHGIYFVKVSGTKGAVMYKIVKNSNS